jgi:hypothetical protein
MSGRFNLQDYVTVDERIDRFWADYPHGAIRTEVVYTNNDGSSVAIKAAVFKDWEHPQPDATGIAQEERGGANANKSSWWENCETSAIGRALANMGMSISKNRPSREEMQKVERVIERGIARSAQDAAPAQTRQVPPYAPELREPTPKPSPPVRASTYSDTTIEARIIAAYQMFEAGERHRAIAKHLQDDWDNLTDAQTVEVDKALAEIERKIDEQRTAGAQRQRAG